MPARRKLRRLRIRRLRRLRCGSGQRSFHRTQQVRSRRRFRCRRHCCRSGRRCRRNGRKSRESHVLRHVRQHVHRNGLSGLQVLRGRQGILRRPRRLQVRLHRSGRLRRGLQIRRHPCGRRRCEGRPRQVRRVRRLRQYLPAEDHRHPAQGKPRNGRLLQQGYGQVRHQGVQSRLHRLQDVRKDL